MGTLYSTPTTELRLDASWVTKKATRKGLKKDGRKGLKKESPRAKNKALEIARNMKALGLDDETIMKATGLVDMN